MMLCFNLPTEVGAKDEQGNAQLSSRRGEVPNIAVPNELVTSSSHMEDDVFVTLTNNDVLHGRGSKVDAHPGNQQFRHIVSRYKDAYQNSPKLSKRRVAACVISIIERLDPPGRFVEKRQDGQYVVASVEKAIRKTSQALREKLPSLASSSVSSSSEIQLDDPPAVERLHEVFTMDRLVGSSTQTTQPPNDPPTPTLPSSANNTWIIDRFNPDDQYADAHEPAVNTSLEVFLHLQRNGHLD